ncbi:MAG: preprotein translocase subunit SecA [Candidatus Gracilibacteria bacterium]|nr:preprotein translocase subunit SecA [Candidatus Gracilibacteria bacterium]MDD3120377.1 preprotein translocase subunit SecA [Candidatus Gracilibacteria bacterium]
MLNEFIRKFITDPTEKKLRKYTAEVEEIKKIEEKFVEEFTTIEQIQTKTQEFKALFEGLDVRVDEDYKKIQKILNEIRKEAFALHRTACKLIYGKEFELENGKKIVWNMIPYDVQLAGALTLHEGSIAEMKTGEGKTLVATLTAYLNALAGFPVHIVTVNDYLAKRDASEMGIIYGTLGLTVGVITNGQHPAMKKGEYSKDIVYATNNELGFDYLRDNMAVSKERQYVGPLFYAIIDEVDSILVDEARTPLIVSSPDSEPTSKYVQFAQVAKQLKNEIHYKIDEKMKTATLTEDGIVEIEKILGVENIFVSAHYNDIHHIENALKAATVYQNDIDYLIKNDEILIIDEHTGRVLPGRRYSNGLHQAIEAKERVTIQQESRTLASVTFQNYFRLYRKLAGMTGTAKTEEEEFCKIYGLDVVVITTNEPVIRDDKADLLFKNEKGKYEYLVNMIKEFNKVGQPVLVGTVSVAKSEYLSDLLKKEKVPHKVLNAKQDEHEAEIIADAGQFGAVTIATNMAGRGTDIKISEEVRTLKGEITIGGEIYKLGGLSVIGTEKHETRRIDNQLRGRSGRQGDPGFSQFFVSPQDDIMRIFGGDKLFSIFNSPMFASIPENEPLVRSSMLTSRIDSVQKQVEGRNFDTRKHILEYDDVLNIHRLVIYSRRNKILDKANLHEDILKIIKDQNIALIDNFFIANNEYEDDDFNKNLAKELSIFFAQEIDEKEIFGKTKEEIIKIIEEKINEKIENLKTEAGEEDFYEFERRLYLQSIDELWMNHIDEMAHLKEEVAFEGYAQKNPLIVYKEKSFGKFEALLSEINFKLTRGLISAKIQNTPEMIEQMNISPEDLKLIMNQIGENNPLLNLERKNDGNDGGVKVYRI